MSELVNSSKLNTFKQYRLFRFEFSFEEKKKHLKEAYMVYENTDLTCKKMKNKRRKHIVKAKTQCFRKTKFKLINDEQGRRKWWMIYKEI